MPLLHLPVPPSREAPTHSASSAGRRQANPGCTTSRVLLPRSNIQGFGLYTVCQFELYSTCNRISAALAALMRRCSILGPASPAVSSAAENPSCLARVLAAAASSCTHAEAEPQIKLDSRL